VDSSLLTIGLNASLTLVGLIIPQTRTVDGVSRMMTFMKKLWQDKRGNALVIAAGALPLVIGSAGLASDTIQWSMWKRSLQRAADSAAIAGVYAEMQDQAVPGAVTRDLTHNNHVGINLLAGSPAIAYPAAEPGWDEAVRVTLQIQKKLSFTSVFLASAPVITASATAAIVPTGRYCVVSLENTAATGILATGNTTLNLGCGMITNSTSMDAAVATGSSDVMASPIAAVGGIESSDNWATGTKLLPFTVAQDDPFADVNPPSSFPTGQCPQFPNGDQDFSATHAAGSVQCYRNFTVQNDVVLGSATYIIDGGSVDIKAQANISCNGCTIILTSRDAATNPASIGNVTINGGATVNLIAPGEGQDYAGLVMYQDRRAQTGTSANQINHINGNSDSSYEGAFYFPNQELRFNGTAGMETACVQMVARRVQFSGNSSIQNVCPPGSGARSFMGRHVRLVA